METRAFFCLLSKAAVKLAPFSRYLEIRGMKNTGIRLQSMKIQTFHNPISKAGISDIILLLVFDAGGSLSTVFLARFYINGASESTRSSQDYRIAHYDFLLPRLHILDFRSTIDSLVPRWAMAVATDTQNQGGFRMQFPHLLGLIYHVFNGDHA
jgi:hypothetical protein